jgi:hypothetical protein
VSSKGFEQELDTNQTRIPEVYFQLPRVKRHLMLSSLELMWFWQLDDCFGSTSVRGDSIHSSNSV